MLALFVLFAAVAVLYAPAIGFSFVWDDHYFVVQNAALRSWSQLPCYFYDVSTYATGAWAPMYRPLRNISYLLDFKLGGLNPAIFHAHNVLLHLLNAGLVFALLLKLQKVRQARSVLTAFLAAMIWGVHPLQTEAVAWVKERDELQFTVYYLLSVFVMLDMLQAASIWFRSYALLGACVMASLLSKEMAVSLPVVLVLLAWFVPSAAPRPQLKYMLAVVVAACLAFVIVRHLVIGRTSQQDYISGNLWHELLTTTKGFGRYLRLTLVPTLLIADYSGYPIVRSVANAHFLIAAASILVLCGCALKLKQRAPLVSLGILWYFATLLPVSNVVPTMQFLAERFLYLPLVGYAVVWMGGVEWLTHFCVNDTSRAEQQRRTIYAIFLSVAYIVILSFLTAVRLPDWKNNNALNESNYRDAPYSSRIALNHASYLAEQGRFAEALELASSISAKNTPGYSERDNPLLERVIGLALQHTANTTESLRHLEHSVALQPDDANGLAALGLYYGMRGDHQNAFKYYSRALAANPTDPAIQQGVALSRSKVAEQTTSSTLVN